MEHEPKDTGAALVGTMIDDRFRVDSVLGVGGMGMVFRCHHLSLGRDVAVKLLHPQLLENEQISARFDREAVSTSRLEHPNILRVLDFGNWTRPDTGAKTKYMVLQFLVGQELAEFLTGPLPPQRAVELALQIAKGLEHAHERGVAHRDLKPENVFVTEDHDGRELLKILDFGLALMVSGAEEGERLTRHGMVFGTPHYMSPEQATGGETDERTDIYALGIMLWEMLAGHPPFDSDDVVAILRQQVTLGLPHEKLPEGTPPQLIALIDEMTAKSAAERLGTAKELRQRLEALARADSDEAPSASVTAMPAVVPAAEESAVAAESTVAAARSSLGTLVAISRDKSEQVGKRFGIPPALVIIGAASIGLLLATSLVVAAVRGGDSASETTGGEEPAKVAGGGWSLGLGDGFEPKLDLSEIDDAIEADNQATALLKIDALLREHPDNPRLNVRKGVLLARQGGKSKAALEAFQVAVKADDEALEERSIQDALVEVFKDPEIGAEGVEFALTGVPEGREKLLLALVNREEGVVSYVDRHRIIAALEADGEDGDIDRRLQRNLDLWQAESAGSPCKLFESTLLAIADDPDEAHVGTLYYTRVPIPKGDEGGCAAVEDKRKALYDEFADKYPEAAKAKAVPKDFESKKKKKKRRRRFRLFD